VSAVNSAGESPLTEEIVTTPHASSSDGGDNTLLYIGLAVVALIAGAGAAQLIMIRKRK
jgi:hypothetical protein